MTPTPNTLFRLEGQLFELLEAREEVLANVQRAIAGPSGCSSNDAGELSPLQESESELAAIETGIQQFIATQLREVDGLRAPLKALEQAVALNKSDAAAATNRAMVLQNRHDALKDVIKMCMVALDQAGEWKPKQTRKFESARGSFTLRGNGGAQPVEITDVSMIPNELCRATVTITASDWQDLIEFVDNELHCRVIFAEPLPNEAESFDIADARRVKDFLESAKVSVEPSKSAIAEALAKPCEMCCGPGVEPRPSEACGECGGSYKRGVPGARLAPRGESLVIK